MFSSHFSITIVNYFPFFVTFLCHTSFLKFSTNARHFTHISCTLQNLIQLIMLNFTIVLVIFY